MAFESLSEKLSAAFKRLKNRGRLTESDVKQAMREVRIALLEADVNYKVAKKFVADVTEKAVGESVLSSLTPAQQVIKIVRDELTVLMGVENAKIKFSDKSPTVVMMCGLQGSGKTTHAAKLAKLFKSQGRRPLLVACDVYRPSAIEQLQKMGEKADVPVFEMGQGDPVKIAKAGIAHAKDYGYDLVFLDTAGRLHIDEALMEELKQIKSITNPHEILLVVDSMIGQDAVTVAESFNNQMEITGIVLTKLDGDTRGGAALSIRSVTGKPIKFAGVGEKIDEIEPFHPDRMAGRILGMGDVMTLIEKAQQEFDEKQAEKTLQKIEKNKLDFNDLLDQMEQLQKMGPLSSIMKMIPGANKIKDEELTAGEKQLIKTKAMINSMTAKERKNPKLIDYGRKRRIAAGSGVEVSDVNRLLKQMEQMQSMVKQMKKKGGFGGGMPGGMPF
ncbi:MAG: signal recognition particle protein [Oscillospiraceae bacterium]|nr:signal recognition particle protein [Oscillospiraceae bacterium]